MNATVEIDRAGRIVVPKKFRDALHLKPGTLLKIERAGEQLVLEQDFPEPRLERRGGVLVLVNGSLLSGEDVNRSIEEERERRMRYVAGLSDEP